MEIQQFDVTAAFIQAKIDKEVYMVLPEGFRKYSKNGKMKKAIYGLKQSPRSWGENVRNALLSFGFTQSEFDPCCYIIDHKGEKVYVLHHVDNFIVFGRTGTLLEEIQVKLRIKYNIKSLGEAKTYFNISIVRDRIRSSVRKVSHTISKRY